MTTTQSSRFALILAFALVYFFWGSTYLAIDIAVEHIPPALMCGVRFTIGGAFMLAFCGWRGKRVVYSATRLAEMAVVGVLLVMVGNLTLTCAERHGASVWAERVVAIN